MNKFNMQLLKKEHKLYYNQEDRLILNGNRTIPPTRLLKKRSLTNKAIELDISKAYTSELKTITEIPLYTVFDKWALYDNSEIKDYTLYLASSKKINLLFNKNII